MSEKELPVKERPEIVKGFTHRVVTGCGNLYITVNYVDNNVFEVFARLGKAGGCPASHIEGLCRVISIGLRSNVNVEEIAKTLIGIQCPNVVAFPKSKAVVSCSDAIGKSLKKTHEMLNAREEAK